MWFGIDEMFRVVKKEGKGMSNLDKQDKLEEQRFWDSQSVDARSINFEKNVYSAFEVQEYVRMFQIAATNLELPENARILDIGCGAGVSTIVLNKMKFRVTGLDISAALISNATELAIKENSNADFIVGDASDMTFESETFDACFMVGLLHHFPNYSPVLDETHRVLKAGGYIIALEPNKLNLSYRASFHLVQRKNGVTTNEYPLSPYILKRDLNLKFDNILINPFRQHDVPFLRQLGWFGRSWMGKIVGKLVRLWRLISPNKIHTGTFFTITGVKKK